MRKGVESFGSGWTQSEQPEAGRSWVGNFYGALRGSGPTPAGPGEDYYQARRCRLLPAFLV